MADQHLAGSNLYIPTQVCLYRLYRYTPLQPTRPPKVTGTDHTAYFIRRHAFRSISHWSIANCLHALTHANVVALPT